MLLPWQHVFKYDNRFDHQDSLLLRFDIMGERAVAPGQVSMHPLSWHLPSLLRLNL